MKIWKRAAALTLALAMAGGTAALAACAPTEEPEEHQHTFATEWTYDETDHWHAATCGHTDQVADKAAHEWTVESETDTEIVYTCICGATQTHEHAFAESWTYDETNHWHAATCGDDAVSEMGAHTYGEPDADGGRTCTVCGYVHFEGHTHTYADEWSYNDTNHWHEATCGHDLRADEGAHTFETVKDGIATSSVCTVCGYASSEYVLEAERTYLNDLSGAGYSGGAVGLAVAVEDYDTDGNNQGDLGASGGYYVSYAYVNGFTLTFEFDSDRAVDDATVVLRISTESQNPMVLSDEQYLVEVNGTAVAYDGINLGPVPSGGKAPFGDYVTIEGVSLVEGYNTIKLITNNDIGMGGTMYATAPMVDCIKIKTSAVLDNTAYDIENFPPLYQ